MGCDDYCCVPLCNHKRSRDSPCQTFYTIPTEPKWLYEQWQARIKRYYKDETGKLRKWEATDNHRICDCHFTEEEKSTILHPKCRKPGRKLVLPSIFPNRLTSTKKQRTTSKATNREYTPPMSKSKPRKLYFATPLRCENNDLSDIPTDEQLRVDEVENEDFEILSHLRESEEEESVEQEMWVPHGHDYVYISYKLNCKLFIFIVSGYFVHNMW
ncbi:uncharacterized protein LOC132722074 [Ruditapes philippinarum]|uniref:uncharacterized protein LOC132722074 n=1 Tax=Ruditapes philippinarum TaxID=129788 RepID=UPI00295B335A|nr:uncharacterized protein LOC132722074 [Ruditapes philippinarum]XP_060562487.1 uncharacterized protein LOC132722074 [Ruditapes philippinarum]